MEDIADKLMPDFFRVSDIIERKFYLTPFNFETGLIKLGYKVTTKDGETYGHVIEMTLEDFNTLKDLVNGI